MQQKKVVVMAMCAIFLASTSPSVAASADKTLPNGQPFQILQTQINTLTTTLDAKLAAVWAKIAELDAAIAANASHDALVDQQIILLQSALADLTRQVAANTASIDVLRAADALQLRLIDALETRISDLDRRVDANTSDIAALILMDQSLQQLISQLAARIGTLESRIAANEADDDALLTEINLLKAQVAAARAEIATKQARITGACSPGYAIRTINSDGSVACEYDDTGLASQSLTVYTQYADGNSSDATAFGSLTVQTTCPSTHRLTGGGFFIQSDVMFIFGSYPVGNSWEIAVRGSWPVSYVFRSYAQCARLQ